MILLLILLNILEIEKVYNSPYDFISGKGFFEKIFFGKEDGRSLNMPLSIKIKEGKIFICDGNFIHKIERGRVEEIRMDNLSCKDMEIVNSKLFVTFSEENFLFFYDLNKKKWEKIPHQFVNLGGLFYWEKERILFITDTGGHKIYTFKDLKIEEFISEGLNFPIDLVVSGDSRIYIADSFDYEIEVRDLEGRRLSSFGGAGEGFGYFKSLRGIAADEEGRIYTTDTGKSWVQIFSSQGELLYVYRDENIVHPFYLDFYKGYLWVPEGFLKKILKIRVNPPK